jgi:hypothetical protein
MTAKNLICVYCHTQNLLDKHSCLACGAPLPKLPPPVPVVSKPKPSASTDIPLETVRKGGEEVDKLFTNAVYAYSLVWRTVAEALVITVVGLGIGIIAGATGVPLLGVAGGVLVGLAVGWAIKAAYFTLLMAPVGMVLGAVFGLVLWVAGLPRAVVLPMIVLAATGGWLGGRRVPFRRRNTWEKVRPFLGLLGGLGFGLIGTLIGWGLQSVVSNWL